MKNNDLRDIQRTLHPLSGELVYILNAIQYFQKSNLCFPQRKHFKFQNNLCN